MVVLEWAVKSNRAIERILHNLEVDASYKGVFCAKITHLARLFYWTIGNQAGGKPEGKSEWI